MPDPEIFEKRKVSKRIARQATLHNTFHNTWRLSSAQVFGVGSFSRETGKPEEQR
jgi:hypothetical protein